MKELQKKLNAKKLSAILITKPENVRYISGFRGSFGYIFVTKKSTYLVTDFRYLSKAKKDLSKKIKVINIVDFPKQLKRYKKVGFEVNHITVGKLKAWKKKYKSITWIETENFIEDFRMTKSQTELKQMKKASDIANAVFEMIQKKVKPGITEREVANEIEHQIKKIGGDGVSFPAIVAFGSNSAIPHHEASSIKLKKNEIILIDMGAKYKGYCSDMTRMILPKKTSELQKKVYSIVEKAQKEAIKNVKPGMKCSELDKIAREIIKKAGYEEKFGHSLGHGVGLEIHEEPRVSEKCNTVLKEGMVITIEPGIYLDGKFGVRLEEMGVVTKGGFKVLTA